jgi:hypothetical protein
MSFQPVTYEGTLIVPGTTSARMCMYVQREGISRQTAWLPTRHVSEGLEVCVEGAGGRLGVRPAKQGPQVAARGLV